MSIQMINRVEKLIRQFENAHKQNLCVVHYYTQGVLVVDIPKKRSAVVPELLLHLETAYPEVIRVNSYDFLEYVRLGIWYDNH